MSGVAHSVVYTRLVVFNPQITYKANGAHGHIPNSDLSPKTIVIKYRFNSRQYNLCIQIYSTCIYSDSTRILNRIGIDFACLDQSRYRELSFSGIK